MNCRELESAMGEMARGALLDAGILGEASSHLECCRECRVRLADEHSLACGLEALASSVGRCEAPPPVEAALLNVFREQRHPAIVESGRPAGWVRIGAIGAVAAAIVAAFLLRMESPRAREIAGSPAVMAKRPTPAQPQASAAVESPARIRRRQRSRPVPAAAQPTPEAPIMTEFLTVSQQDGWTPLEGGRLVRVRLPQSALGVFGLPVNEERRAERVQADVMLSDDGLVRAIRFVK